MPAATELGRIVKTYTSTLAPEDIDLENFTATPTITAEGIDRDGEVVLPSAIDQDIADYLASPKFLWNHRRDGSPEETMGQCLALVAHEKGWRATFSYDVDINEQAALVWKQTVKGSQRGFSICFIPLEWVTKKSPRAEIMALPERERNWLLSGQCKTVYTRVAIIEISAVHVPAHAKAILKGIEEDSGMPVKSKAGATLSASSKEVLAKAMAHAESGVRCSLKALGHLNELCKSAGCDDAWPADFPEMSLDEQDDEQDEEQDDEDKGKALKIKALGVTSKSHALINDVSVRLYGLAQTLQGGWSERESELMPPEERLEAALAILASITAQVEAMLPKASVDDPGEPGEVELSVSVEGAKEKSVDSKSTEEKPVEQGADFDPAAFLAKSLFK